MKELNIKLLLPYNWGHIRKIKVYSDKGVLLTKIMHGEELKLTIDESVSNVVIKLDFYKSVIKVPEGDKVFLALFMDFRDRFPHKYIDTLKRKCLTGKFLTEDEFENFDLTFYTKSFQWVQKTQIDKPSLFLGFLLAVGLTVMSIVEQSNPYQDIVFLIGVGSFFSLMMIQIENHKILLYDYKSRMIATGIAYLLGSLFLQSSFPATTLFILFSIVFLLKSIYSIKELVHKINLEKE
ncbi:hypothetical protein [Flavobacterium sp. NRK1]|uniref:hypothetical protein n=1 Tax=Flavobacterium sp. NRK1 TaxID=2954929 RepID=UPI0020921E4F|nr:hypothetical protein [Flavobacterium sp. NRK1]MCO6148241.1 hypothetical protein [Flavobacterium sp. NRK1]